MSIRPRNQAPAPVAEYTRPRWSRIARGASVLLLAAGFAVTWVFQFGLPWWGGDGDVDHLFRAADGTSLNYQVHLPPDYDGRAELPVMMAIHGCGMTGFGWNSMKHTTQFNPLADREGFIVVYPTQRPFESAINCWNSADPRNQQRGGGEPDLLAGIAREVVDTYSADADRVHVAGASSGAGAAVILGATYPDLFATVTSVAGGEYGLNRVDPDDPDATPPSETARQAWAQMADRERQVPMLVIQGEADDVVAPIVAERLVEHWTVVNDFVDDGLSNNSLDLTESTESVPAAGNLHPYEHTTWVTTNGRTLIEYYLVGSMEHAWSGPGGEGYFTDRDGPDAAELAWRFAQKHDLDPNA